ncbi:MAG: ABC transporter substrate-binding protein [Chloroflexi bacterium]|nr:ABC transporter substrate-binding protein [Chloroflexota bacterium]
MAERIEATGSRLGRRTLLRVTIIGAGGVAAAALLGCGGGDEDEPQAAAPAGGAGTAAAVSTIGKFVKDDALPYPYNFPEPAGKTPKPGGVMTVAATWDVADIDPTKSAAGGTVTIPNMFYNRLIGIQRGPKADVFNAPILEPELAKSWERTPDGLMFTFKIQDGIKWQNLSPLNGRPFVAADARFAMERYASTGVHRQYYANVAGYEVPDATTLRVKMSRPVADFLNPLGSNKQTVFPRELVDDGTISKRGIGTGPMILKDMVASSKVTFDKNPDYWEGKVLLDGFEFRIQPDHAARLAAFRAGQVEYAYSVVATFSDLAALKRTNPDIQVNLHPTVASLSLAMNNQLSKYQDVRVRRAISLAVDRPVILQLVYENMGKALNNIPWSYVFDKEPTFQSGNLGKWATRNVAEAKALLAAAGAEKLVLNNIFYAYDSNFEKLPEVLIPQLREAGITVSGGKVDYTEFNSQWTGAKLPDFSTSGWATQGYDPDNWFYGQVHSKSPGNRWQFKDPEIDAWAEAQQVELNAEKRKELWRKIWDKDLDQAYRPPLASGLGIQVYQPWMRGIRWTGTIPGDNSSYYSWGDQVWYGWLDK